MASGSTHRNGTEATFCVMCVVTDSSSTEPEAASSSHSDCSRPDGGAPLAAATGTGSPAAASPGAAADGAGTSTACTCAGRAREATQALARASSTNAT